MDLSGEGIPLSCFLCMAITTLRTMALETSPEPMIRMLRKLCIREDVLKIPRFQIVYSSNVIAQDFAAASGGGGDLSSLPLPVPSFGVGWCREPCRATQASGTVFF